jgi:hypothetical protein
VGSIRCVERFTTGSRNLSRTFECRRWCPTRSPSWDCDRSKDFYAAGFDGLVKRWDKCIKVGWGYFEKETFFPVSNITCFTFYIHLWPIYWLSLVHFLPPPKDRKLKQFTIFWSVVDYVRSRGREGSGCYVSREGNIHVEKEYIITLANFAN